MKVFRYISSLVVAFVLFVGTASAQGTIVGRVTSGMSEEDPLSNIMLETSSGETAFTNGSGLFMIRFQLHDTLFFYYQGKRTVSYLTDTIPHENFAVPLFMVRKRVMEGAKTKLNPALMAVDTAYNNVTVRARNYSQDSLERRQQYANAFGYTKPSMKYGKDWTPTSLNVGKLYETLNVKKKKQNEMLKGNLLREEKEGYVTSRFNASFIRKNLGEDISESTLEDFMRKKRPKLEDIQGMSELELIDFVRRAYADYKSGK
ncbi:MAG: hypothetical protein QM610_01770 [Chitinophagaceae bacterium]